MATSTLGSGTLVLAGTTSGTTTVTATAVAGTTTLTLPAATDTLVGKATTDTLTNKTLTGAAMNGTLGATTPSTAAVTTLNATGGSANPLPSNFSILATSGLAKLYSYWSDNSARGSFEFHVAGGNGSLDLTAFTITDGASAKVKNVVSVGDATPSTSGAGITFPATDSPSSNANTLDDYEEGTWPVGISFGGGTTGITYNTGGQTGTYTKVGRLVTCIGYLALTSKGSSTGAASITGLPFAVAAGEPNYAGISFGYIYQMSFAAVPFGRVSAGTTTILLSETTNAGVDSDITNADFTNTTALRFSFTYFA